MVSKMTNIGLHLFFGITSILLIRECQSQHPREGFFNSTSYVTLYPPITLNKHIGLSFRTCNGGPLFSQRSSSHYTITLEVRPEGLFFTVKILSRRYESRISANFLDNEWHTVNILYRLGNLTMSTSGHQQIIANSTYQSEILTQTELSKDNAVLVVGNGFIGCILEGPSIVFNSSQYPAHNVEWGPCPLPSNACAVVDHCAHEPCMMHGRCISLPDRYHCQCTPRYSGNNCQIDNGPPCERNPCKNNGKCLEDKTGNYTCICPPNFVGKECDIEITSQLCENNPCHNEGTCHMTANSNNYECFCLPGFTGKDCEININECLSSPCQHGGTCIDGINNYTCFCGRTGYSGVNCETNINECENNPCLNNGVCFDNYGGYTCQCSPGFGGQNCELKLSECASNPCSFPNSICVDAPNSYQCVCKPGYVGVPPNCSRNDACSSMPCMNSASCRPTLDGYTCLCPAGFTGTLCEVNLDDCSSSPCLNGGTCTNKPIGYTCSCPEGFNGINCEMEMNGCASQPCLNNGTCISKSGKEDYYCECPVGFEGMFCENNINDCLKSAWCPEDKVCVDGMNSFECRCANGLSGPNCSVGMAVCRENPCLHGGTCIENNGNYTCECPPEYYGMHCESDVNECDAKPRICNNGICVNHEGGYQCFCTPGFSGEHCDLDFDECLSHPCTNGATCENKVNSFNCICPPGYSGKDCSVNINECESNPCVSGSTCIDEIATFSCLCPVGLTGRLCETNIDDCKSSPCLNSGLCIDGLNSYTCNCTNTGYQGKHCETNIDECISNPCTHGAKCRDLVKGYVCECFPGYTGINCETDINECESNPCQFGGTCKERSNLSYYLPEHSKNSTINGGLSVFNQNFDYSTAAGYECICVNGITGPNCEININDCESSPCKWGTCSDLIAGYKCDCEEGFEGVHCDIEINECDRFKPCVYGICYDKRAGYFCECDENYGGKNCSVELTGCLQNECLNGGTCMPYLENETVHKFNCSCPNGFQGPVCEKVTTMSLNGSSYVMVNTTRDEGYDIQLRFQTTLPNGLLAIGTGSTFYILELVNGRLNLKSSLVNKWEGVFIGSVLNDSNWQKVFVAINSSHLVLAANEEQTIYPTNLNEGANASQTSFPTTYLGGTISYLRRLARGPSAFVGCVQDVMINGQWVLPQDSGIQPISLVGVETGCKRESQCDPNPCHSGGRCIDLWRDFVCTCQRPYLGHICQYNLTAATFGHENITDSVVTVSVDPSARRAVRSIMDISMFIRTREPSGGIFYLGSKPDSVPYSDETVISAKLAGGELQVSIQFNAAVESYTVGGVRLDNGFNHLIQVVRNVTLVQVKINQTEYFRKTISASGQLDLHVLQLGAIPNPSSPERNFKGVIQDVQMSNGSRVMVVEFFPLSAEDLVIPPPLGRVEFDPDRVLNGIVSDDSCRSEPCMHGGTCTVTWNDFSCLCTVGYKGKQCQEMEFCQVQDCPDGSECRNLHHGYECVANITLHDPSPVAPGLRYRLTQGDLRVALNDVSITYRSRTGGTIFQVGPDPQNRYLAVSVYKEQIRVSWDIGLGENSKVVTKEADDGDWTTLLLRISDTELTGGLSGASEESPQYFTANFSRSAWHELLLESNITIGGAESILSPDTYLTAEGSDRSNALEFIHQNEETKVKKALYKGCVGEVRIGGLLLPYFTAEELNVTNASARDHFELLPGSSAGEELGCTLCYDTECANGGNCTNPIKLYTCTCSPGYAGDDCSENINECIDNDCKNNSTCVDGIANYTCQCLAGWQGALCDIEIDECASSPCLNNGECIDHLAMFECICGPEYVGLRCEQLRQVTCDNAPCHNNALCQDIFNPQTNDNFTCTCQENFVGHYCESPFCQVTPCKNKGICVSNAMRPVCECMAGFTGKLCEIDVNECESNPCQHNGKCIDGVAVYHCDCSNTGFTGTTCDMDIDECSSENISCGPSGHCLNTIGSYHCRCLEGSCGFTCDFLDPCFGASPCENEGICMTNCTDHADYFCECIHGFYGKNCSQIPESAGSSVADIALIVVPILSILLIVGVVLLTVFLMMARKKRATRGTYSPSSQEYCNPRVELDNVMKPPPEERLI